MSKPGRFYRPNADELYTQQLQAQENARAAEKAKKAAAAEQAKKQQQLTSAIQAEGTFLSQKIVAERALASNKQTLLNMKAAAVSSSGPGGSTVTSAEQTAINQYYALQIAPLESQITQLTKSYTNAVATRQNIEKSIVQNSTTSAQKEVQLNKARKTIKKPQINSAGSDVIENAGYSPVVYKYNAPMTKTAYLNPFGPQQQTSSRSVTDPGSYSDAKIAWSEEAKASRGTIQMSLAYATNMSSANSTSKSTYDDTLYGFKFLYNPKEVTMSWGIAEGVNPDVIQSGLDKSSPVGLGLMSSTVSFSILLNRTNDMSYLDSNGLMAGITNPYPSQISSDDLKIIYKKGTMYDMEYLFRTINGLNSIHDSSLNGKTADQGWLNGTPVELHLGDGMRYLIRIGSLDISHAIFNERMVPILSTVNVTCHRFYDRTTGEDTSRTYSGGGAALDIFR
jgi:hypothetical protein